MEIRVRPSPSLDPFLCHDLFFNGGCDAHVDNFFLHHPCLHYNPYMMATNLMLKTEEAPFPYNSIPIVFFNGRYDVDAGDIVLHPSLDYKHLKINLSVMFGIPPRKISIFLVRRRNIRSQPTRILIDESSDFAAISFARHCFFLATEKRFQRMRTQPRMGRSRKADVESERKTAEVKSPVMEILRWSPERCFPKKVVPKRHYEVKAAAAAASRKLCKNCMASKENELSPEFHHCVYDEVVLEFNTTAGPIIISF